MGKMIDADILQEEINKLKVSPDAKQMIWSLDVDYIIKELAEKAETRTIMPGLRWKKVLKKSH